jgi:hypothetical protein
MKVNVPSCVEWGDIYGIREEKKKTLKEVVMLQLKELLLLD